MTGNVLVLKPSAKALRATLTDRPLKSANEQQTTNSLVDMSFARQAFIVNPSLEVQGNKGGGEVI